MLLPSLKRNILDEENGPFPMCTVLLHIIVWGGPGTEEVSQTEGLSNIHLLLAKDF